jgi:hypothetical protein
MANRNQVRVSRLSPAHEIIEWADDIVLELITQRRRHQQLFADNTRHDSLWTRIANYIRGRYGYEVTARQCQVKWYALKRGYENLKRLYSADPDADGVAIRSPHWHDRLFYSNLTDEFWLQGGDYLNFKNNYLCNYLYKFEYLFI